MTSPIGSQSATPANSLYTSSSSPLAGLSGTPEEMLAQMQRGLSLANAMMAAEIVDGDKESARVLLGSNRLRELRGVIGERLNDLKAAKAFIQEIAKGKTETAYSVGPEDWAKFAAQHPKIAARYPGGFSQMMEGVSYKLKEGKIETEPAGRMGTVYTDGANERIARFSADDVTVGIDQLTNDQQSVDSQKELLTTLLQQLVQRKQRIMTTQSNVDAANHGALKTVASNTR